MKERPHPCWVLPSTLTRQRPRGMEMPQRGGSADPSPNPHGWPGLRLSPGTKRCSPGVLGGPKGSRLLSPTSPVDGDQEENVGLGGFSWSFPGPRGWMCPFSTPTQGDLEAWGGVLTCDQERHGLTGEGPHVLVIGAITPVFPSVRCGHRAQWELGLCSSGSGLSVAGPPLPEQEEGARACGHSAAEGHVLPGGHHRCRQNQEGGCVI